MKEKVLSQMNEFLSMFAYVGQERKMSIVAAFLLLHSCCSPVLKTIKFFVNFSNFGNFSVLSGRFFQRLG